MSNRLQIFRERMAAFEGAANPQEAIENGYYVRAPGQLLAEKLSARVALRPASSHLLIGGIGSGKTTQLLVACEKLKEIGDIYPIYIDVSLYADISKINPGVLTAIAGVELAELVGGIDNETIENSTETIFNIAYGYQEAIDAQLGNFGKFRRKGIIPEKHNYGLQKNLIEAVNTLVEHSVNEYGKIVLFFDGLDRLGNLKIFSDILVSDAKAITNANVGFVIVGPSIFLYGNNSTYIENYLDYFYRQPCFDIENDIDAYKFFLKILEVRFKDNFIEDEAIGLIIKYSGGVLRDLISLTQAAIEETYISGDDKIKDKHIFDAVVSLGKSQILGLSNEELEILQIIMKKGNFIPRTDQDIKLLVTRRIIEYIYPKQRYAVHPAIVPIIEQIYA